MRISGSGENYDLASEASWMVLIGISEAPSHASISFLSRTITSKGMIVLADQALVSLATFLTGVIIGRACTKEELGLYMLGLSIVFFVSSLQISLISTPYMVYSPSLKGRARDQYTGTTLIYQLTLSALVMLVLALGGVLLSIGFGPQDLSAVMWTLVIVILFIMFRDCVRRICFARLRMKSAFILDACVSLIQIGGLLALAYLGVLSASRVYCVIGIACGIATLGLLISSRKAIAFRAKQAVSDFGRNWLLGKWVCASGLLWALGMNLFPWILLSFHGAASAGVWAACLGITAASNPLLFGMQNFLGPQIAHSYAEGGAMALRGCVFKANLVFCIPMMFFCVVLLVFGGPLVAFFYGAKYAGNGLIVSILALNLLVSAAAFSFSRGLFAIGRADLDFTANFLALFVLITFGFRLVPSFGPVGAACGLLITNAIGLGVKCPAFTIVVHALARRQTK